MASWDDCGFQSGSQQTAFTINGKVVANNFYSDARTEWIRTPSWWRARTTEFLDQLASGSPILYFQSWLESNYGLDPAPKLIVQPDPAAPSYHWPTWSQPLFVAHPDDGGLRWDVLEVREVP
jgi:hypothetical protein